MAITLTLDCDECGGIPAQCSGCKMAPITGRACTLHGAAGQESAGG